MPRLQIAIDCRDPRVLAEFWATALDLETEDHYDQIRTLTAQGIAGEEDVIERDGRLAWRTGAACRDPSGALPRIIFQQVPEPKTSNNRVHLDVHVGPEHREARIDSLIAAGATRLWDGRQGSHTWDTLADPEGNEFCVA